METTTATADTLGKHTPGNWIAGTGKVKQFDGEFLAVGVPGKDKDSTFTAVALLSTLERANAQDEANALLIAAAPDMLQALLVAREFISTDRNALADTCTTADGSIDNEDDAAAIGDYDAALLQISAAIQKAGAA